MSNEIIIDRLKGSPESKQKMLERFGCAFSDLHKNYRTFELNSKFSWVCIEDNSLAYPCDSKGYTWYWETKEEAVAHCKLYWEDDGDSVLSAFHRNCDCAICKQE